MHQCQLALCRESRKRARPPGHPNALEVAEPTNRRFELLRLERPSPARAEFVGALLELLAVEVDGMRHVGSGWIRRH
jgi:hypothetical protein